jgi:hypothetical protein
MVIDRPGRPPLRPVLLRALVDSGADRGPAFTLSPVFIDGGSFLLGRADFFSVFTVTFEEGRGRIFHLDT